MRRSLVLVCAGDVADSANRSATDRLGACVAIAGCQGRHMINARIRSLEGDVCSRSRRSAILGNGDRLLPDCQGAASVPV